MKHCLACKLCTGRIYCLKILEVMNHPLEKKIPKKIREHPAQTLQQGSLWPCKGLLHVFTPSITVLL